MSQKRLATKDRLAAEHDYAINVNAETGIADLHAKLDALRQAQRDELLALQRRQIVLPERRSGRRCGRLRWGGDPLRASPSSHSETPFRPLPKVRGEDLLGAVNNNGYLTRQLAWLRGLKVPREPRWLGRVYLWRLFVQAIRDFLADDCTTHASVIAYATLLSLFPTLLVVLTVIGYVIADPHTQAEFVVGVASIFPGAGDLIQQTVATVVQHRGSATIFATLTLLWSASGVFSSVNRYLNAIWRAPTDRGFIESSILAGFMVIAVALLYLVSLLMSALLQFAGRLTVPILGFELSSTPALYPESVLALPALTAIGLFTLMYRFVPNVAVDWSCARRGGIVAGLFFELGKQLFGLYLTTFAKLDAVYGSIGAVIALLLWAYFSANILLFGCEISHVAATLEAEHRTPQSPVD